MDWLNVVFGILLLFCIGLSIFLGFFYNRPRVIVKARLSVSQDSPPKKFVTLRIINNRDQNLSISKAGFILSRDMPYFVGKFAPIQLEPYSSYRYLLPFQEMQKILTQSNKKIERAIVLDNIENLYKGKPDKILLEAFNDDKL